MPSRAPQLGNWTRQLPSAPRLWPPSSGVSLISAALPSAGIPFRFEALDASALLSLLVAVHAVHLREGLRAHLEPSAAYRFVHGERAARARFLTPAAKASAEASERWATYLLASSAMFAVLQLLLVKERAESGHVGMFASYTLPMLALSTEAAFFTLFAISHPVVSMRARTMLGWARDPWALVPMLIAGGAFWLVPLLAPEGTTPAVSPLSGLTNGNFGARFTLAGLLFALLYLSAALTAAAHAVSGPQLRSVHLAQSVAAVLARAPSLLPTEAVPCEQRSAASREATLHRSARPFVACRPRERDGPPAHECHDLEDKCDPCEQELRAVLSRVADDHEDEGLTAAGLTRVVGRRAVPLNDCGGVDGAALLTWRLIGELAEWDGAKKPPKDALAVLTDSNAPLLGCSLDALVTDKPCPVPAEGHGLAHLGPDLGLLRKWHTTYVQKVKAELATATARVDGVDLMLGQCVVKQAADPTTGDVPNPCVEKGPAQDKSRCMWATQQWKNVEPARTIKPTPTARRKKPLTDTGMGMDLGMQTKMLKKMMMTGQPEELPTAIEIKDPADEKRAEEQRQIQREMSNLHPPPKDIVEFMKGMVLRVLVIVVMTSAMFAAGPMAYISPILLAVFSLSIIVLSAMAFGWFGCSMAKKALTILVQIEDALQWRGRHVANEMLAELKC